MDGDKYNPEWEKANPSLVHRVTPAQMAEAEFRMSQESNRRMQDPEYREKMYMARESALAEIGIPTRISQQIAELHDQLAKTHALFTELKIRIEPILIPEQDSNKALSDEETRVQSSEVGEALCDIRGAVGKLQRRIGETMERVQL